VEEGGKVNIGDKIAFIAGEGEEAPKKDEAPKKEEKKEPAKKEEKAEGKKEKKPQAETEKPAPIEKKEKETAPPQDEKKSEEAEKKEAAPAAKIDNAEEARVKASPVARRVAAELGVDLASVKGTGPDGRVTETDVRAAAKSKGAAPAQKAPAAAKSSAPSIKAGEGARIQLSGMRKIIAQRLVESLGPIPHIYLTIEINAAPLMAAREELKSAGEGADTAKITVNDFVLKAAVMNPPQGFILAVGKVNKVPVADDSDQIVVGHRMSITMSCDHRVIDGALGAEYLKELRHLLENPALLLV